MQTLWRFFDRRRADRKLEMVRGFERQLASLLGVERSSIFDILSSKIVNNIQLQMNDLILVIKQNGAFWFVQLAGVHFQLKSAQNNELAVAHVSSGFFQNKWLQETFSRPFDGYINQELHAIIKRNIRVIDIQRISISWALGERESSARGPPQPGLKRRAANQLRFEVKLVQINLDNKQIQMADAFGSQWQFYQLRF